LQAYLVVGCDLHGEVFVSCNYNDKDKMSEILFLIVSGAISEDCLASVRECSRSDFEAQIILANVFNWLKMKMEQDTTQTKSKPVIDPTEVFRQGERNEYKG
jgi:hypothetical protein